MLLGWKETAKYWNTDTTVDLGPIWAEAEPDWFSRIKIEAMPIMRNLQSIGSTEFTQACRMLAKRVSVQCKPLESQLDRRLRRHALLSLEIVLDAIASAAGFDDPHFPFINEIGNAPHSLVPRLVYADWLEEQGDERASWLRLECKCKGRLIGGQGSADSTWHRIMDRKELARCLSTDVD